LLEVTGIETFYGASQILFGVSLAVREGQVVTLLGRNGMGKTTTVKSIMGVARYKSGRVSFGGRDLTVSPGGGLTRLPAQELRMFRKAGMSFPTSRCGKTSWRPKDAALRKEPRGLTIKS
jgi:ABC-type sugar transport system ATPase subunit